MKSERRGDRLYTLAEIRAAFWKAFHRRGELWFDDIGPEADCGESTEAYWDDLRDALERPSS